MKINLSSAEIRQLFTLPESDRETILDYMETCEKTDDVETVPAPGSKSEKADRLYRKTIKRARARRRRLTRRKPTKSAQGYSRNFPESNLTAEQIGYVAWDGRPYVDLSTLNGNRELYADVSITSVSNMTKAMACLNELSIYLTPRSYLPQR